jgi:hypothetical protein
MTGALLAPRWQGALFLAQSEMIPLRFICLVLNRRGQDFFRSFQSTCLACWLAWPANAGQGD